LPTADYIGKIGPQVRCSISLDEKIVNFQNPAPTASREVSQPHPISRRGLQSTRNPSGITKVEPLLILEEHMAEKTVDEYIKSLDESKGAIVARARAIILAAAPEAKESIKWAQPVFEKGGPFAYIKAFKNSVNFGFWRGIELDDPAGLLQGTGEKMRHIKLTSLEDIQEEAFATLVRQAVEMNQIKGDPTRG
jgi:hypothetical protein